MFLCSRLLVFFTKLLELLNFFFKQSGLQSPSTSSVASTSSNLSSPAFDHESLFRDVDDEIERDYETLERKRDMKHKRPTTPTYRAQMEIIQLKVKKMFTHCYHTSLQRQNH